MWKNKQECWLRDLSKVSTQTQPLVRGVEIGCFHVRGGMEPCGYERAWLCHLLAMSSWQVRTLRVSFLYLKSEFIIISILKNSHLKI